MYPCSGTHLFKFPTVRILRNRNAPTPFHENRNDFDISISDTNDTANTAFTFELRHCRSRRESDRDLNRATSASFDTGRVNNRTRRRTKGEAMIITREDENEQDEPISHDKPQPATLTVWGRHDDCQIRRQRATRQPSAGSTHAPFTPCAQPCFYKSYPYATNLLSNTCLLISFFLFFFSVALMLPRVLKFLYECKISITCYAY